MDGEREEERCIVEGELESETLVGCWMDGQIDGKREKLMEGDTHQEGGYKEIV